jgi:hypothetical protein
MRTRELGIPTLVKVVRISSSERPSSCLSANHVRVLCNRRCSSRAPALLGARAFEAFVDALAFERSSRLHALSHDQVSKSKTRTCPSQLALVSTGLLPAQ